MRVRIFTVLSAVVPVLVLIGASDAGATSVIGFGNSAIDNHCTNRSPQAHATTASPGAGTSQSVGVLLGIPANQCGNLGLPLADDRIASAASSSRRGGYGGCCNACGQCGGGAYAPRDVSRSGSSQSLSQSSSSSSQY